MYQGTKIRMNLDFVLKTMQTEDNGITPSMR